MVGSRRLGSRLVLLAVAGAVVAPAIWAAQGPAVKQREEFMRSKLAFSQGILEGLTMEDYGLIAENARKLKVLSQAAEWEVPSIPNVEMYLPYTNEFQRLCDELGTKARDHNIDGATLVYTQLTINCVTCHKYVRGDMQ